MFEEYEIAYTDEDLTTFGHDEMMSATEEAYWLVETERLSFHDAFDNISSVVTEFVDDPIEVNTIVMDLWDTYEDFINDRGGDYGY